MATSAAALLLAGTLTGCGAGTDNDSAAQDPRTSTSEDDTAPASETGAAHEQGQSSDQAGIAGFVVKSSGNPFADARAAADTCP